MNNESRFILNELLRLGLIKNDNDLTAGESTSIIFDYMIKNYSYLLDNDIDVSLPKSDFEKGKIIHKIIIKLGKYFLNNPQIIEDRAKLLEGDNETFPEEDRDSFKGKVKVGDEPVIFVTNHGFKDDVLATILASEKRAYIVFGSLPQFYGTIDGLLACKNGVVMVNRKVSESKRSSIEKSKYVLENGISLMVCPEGVWNKKPNGGMLDFWSGFYRIAKKSDGTFYKIVPIIHYIKNTHKAGKDNPIHTVVDNPIVLDGMNEKEGIEYVRNRMQTWYWKLMENYGKSSREELLAGYNNTTEAWEDELEKRVATTGKYDIEIEICADKRRKDEPLQVWEPIANQEITKENALEVTKARELVRELKRNDFQHRY